MIVAATPKPSRPKAAKATGTLTIFRIERTTTEA
jgi:hypothetical protein